MKCGAVSVLEGILPQNWHIGQMYVDKFMTSRYSARDISELVPHYAQCLLMLGISMERYLLICHAASANIYYKGFRRVSFYIIATSAFLIPAATPVIEALYYIATDHHSYLARKFSSKQYLNSIHSRNFFPLRIQLLIRTSRFGQACFKISLSLSLS